jgi:phospholipid/cholesterol/gamma-HCH transport system ATP-binding protein
MPPASPATRKDQPVSVEVKDLEVSFGATTVLHDISFEVNPGEIFVIMGPSGSGKSVLLRTLIGLLTPSKGSVTIDGQDARDPRTHEAVKSALVFQAGALFNSMTVYDNLAFYPREHRSAREAEIRRKVETTLRMFSLEDAAGKLPSELSGGMRKRVAIARTLVMEPRLLLYDEPTSELDPVMAATISEIIGSLREELQVTSVVVSHDRDLATSIADRMILLEEGRIVAAGTPAEILDSSEATIQAFFHPEINVQQPRYRTSLPNPQES